MSIYLTTRKLLLIEQRNVNIPGSKLLRSCHSRRTGTDDSDIQVA